MNIMRIENQYTKGCGDPDGLSSQAKYIQGRYNSVRELQRELPPLLLFQLLIQLSHVQFRYRLKIPKQPEHLVSVLISVVSMLYSANSFIREKLFSFLAHEQSL